MSRIICNSGPLIALGILARLDMPSLQAIGSARILVEAKKNNLLPDIASQFQKLRQEGYWIHDSIVQTALREAGDI